MLNILRIIGTFRYVNIRIFWNVFKWTVTQLLITIINNITWSILIQWISFIWSATQVTIWPSKHKRKRTYCLWQTLSHQQLDKAKVRGYCKFSELCIGCKRKTYELTMQLSSLCCFILLNDNTYQWIRYTVSVSEYFSKKMFINTYFKICFETGKIIM